MSRATRTFAFVAAALGSLALASTASALDPRTEAAAKAALKRASEKYLATDFASAIGILRKAAGECDGARCSAATKAAVLRDLGIMQFREGDGASAQRSFADALALEPGLTLGSDYDTPDVRAVFEAAKGGADEPTEPADAGDFTHTPATEQKANTPLPVYAEISSTEVARAFVKYRGAGMKDWARIEMRRMGKGWGALVPCSAVTVGTTRYWLQGFDSNGDPTATSGDPKHSFEVPIRAQIASEAPHLPGRSAPQSCDEGAAPEEPGRVAPDEEPSETPGTESGAPAGPSAYARWWIGVAGAIDFLSLPGGDDVCALTQGGAPANASGYYCTNPSGSNFPSRSDVSQNDSLLAGQAGHVDGGVRPGDLRALVAVDYALTPDVLIGARLGYVLNTYPSGGAAIVDHRAFGGKIHLEARGTYVFGDAPLSHEGFAPTVFASVGMAEFDGHVATVVSMSQKASNLSISQPVNVWLTNGPWFVATGGGARYAFSARAAFNATFRVNLAFGGAGALFTFGPEIALQYGF
jgi:hypothetical protein